MPHRAHLFSLRAGHAIRESLSEGYQKKHLLKDMLSGLTVGIIAIPLAMALAIASGVAPQYGLYTAIIGGFVIAMTGGSRFSVSGPTAAFVIILYPIVQEYGFAGLLIATIMAGIILIIMAYARLGRLIEYIPESVTLGFTGGIAIVIATLQIKDFFGLELASLPENYIDKVVLLINSLSSFDIASLSVALFTLFIMLAWPKLKTPIPPHLPAIILGSMLAVLLNNHGFTVDTIGTRFSYFLPDGSSAAGIPPFLPYFEWPWLRDGPGNAPLAISWSLFRDLLPAAFAIAMLGAIESLLCAVVLDGMTGKRHSANSELLGLGLGNVIAPFFGGITATAAIARSAANFKSGAVSPVSAMIHALVVLVGLLFLAPLLTFLPMPSMAALLIIVAWNMSEAPKTLRLFKRAPKSDVWVLLTCLFLTVLFDMVLAITAGILLASLLFMKEIAEMTKLTDITASNRIVESGFSSEVLVFKINGPLFFAAADRIFSELVLKSQNARIVILYLDGVPLLDAGGLAAISKFISQCEKENKKIIFSDFQFQPLKTLSRAQITPIDGVTEFHSTLQEALDSTAFEMKTSSGTKHDNK